MITTVMPSAATKTVAPGALPVRALPAVRNWLSWPFFQRSAAPKTTITSTKANSGPTRAMRCSNHHVGPTRIGFGSRSGSDMRGPSILVLIGLEKLLDAGFGHVFRGGDGRARVDSLGDLFALQMLVHRHHGFVAHLHRVLQHDALRLLGGQPADQGVVRIEGDKADLAVQLGLLERPQATAGVRLADCEQAVDLFLVLVED